MKKTYWILLFLFINFGGLALGILLMNDGPRSQWYLNLNKAPWTPPGWVFGAAWTLIMVCFSIYLSDLFTIRNSKFVKILFVIQVVLNISWNFVFFNQHLINIGVLNISLLTLLIFYLFISFGDDTLSKSKYLLLPYMIWLCIATSLNTYIAIYN
ncbi:TspO/MBR family protein [Winogradskyella immobilis]|uniref:TspO/MBR family protein n=1 Tax=Winogradskyella immobilis TaxID=2816852 RepID=UPI001D0CB235|nr:TspO/MBR family protein [Winogradskyella immobilis]MCG0016372.1 tryptophan-rich sensory protein [Winogradskyella immobilis]